MHQNLWDIANTKYKVFKRHAYNLKLDQKFDTKNEESKPEEKTREDIIIKAEN